MSNRYDLGRIDDAADIFVEDEYSGYIERIYDNGGSEHIVDFTVNGDYDIDLLKLARGVHKKLMRLKLRHNRS